MLKHANRDPRDTCLPDTGQGQLVIQRSVRMPPVVNVAFGTLAQNIPLGITPDCHCRACIGCRRGSHSDAKCSSSGASLPGGVPLGAEVGAR